VVQEATEPGVSSEFAETLRLTASLVDVNLDTSRWGVSARMSRRLTKHIYASLRYTYNEQTSKATTAGSTSDFSNHLVSLGVQYKFDRWRLW
jgi:opacity protein-like surface antigen